MQAFCFLAVLLCFSCNLFPDAPSSGKPVKPMHDTVPTPYFPKPDREYAASRTLTDKSRKTLKTAYARGGISADSVGKAFTNCLLETIIPYWYGTPWTFTGHTEIPGQGDIACGYFVSTTLLHAGLNLNRYRLAQQGPSDEALMLSLGDTVRVTRCDDATQALDHWRTALRDGLYFVGLGANHVGFLLKSGPGLFLIHSNYAGQREVQLQPVEESVLMDFREFFLADITYNRRLIEHWMSGEAVPLRNTGVLADEK